MAASRTHHTGADPHMFTSSDDNAMLKYILATHAPDGTYFDVKPFLEIIQNIVHMADQANRVEPGSIVERLISNDVNEILEVMALTINKANRVEPGSIVERLISNDVNEILEVMALTINKVSCEISSKCIEGVDAHTTTMGILNMLSNYVWDAKAVITLSAFAGNYAEFWLVAQLYISNPLAQSVTRLKQLPNMLKHASEALKSQFETVSNLIKAMLDLTGCIVEFKILPAQYIRPETPELMIATTHIPTAVYWIIRSSVACASILINLIGTGQQQIMKTTEGWELSSLAHKISTFQDHLRNQLVSCYQHIEENRQTEAYQTILRVMETPHLDNLTPLKHLISVTDDLQPLYDNRLEKRVDIYVLKKKVVLLLISDLDVSVEELLVLGTMYVEATYKTKIGYEVVWLPMVPTDREAPFTDAYQRRFEQLKSIFEGYSVYPPSSLQPAVIKYIKEVWHFNHKPLLVVMDPQGRIVNTNALHMMWIWGNEAFPFTRQKEEALWEKETWRMELLVDHIDPIISEWIADGKYICLYGGEDIQWIRKFTRIAQEVARAAQIQLEMLYVGKSNPREKVRRNNIIIQQEKLSHIFPDLTLIWYFWVRLESMLYSKMKHTKSSDLDSILQEINSMLTYDGSDEGWAVICHDSYEWMQRANGKNVLTSLTNYERWKDNAPVIGFMQALNDDLRKISSPHHCNRLILPGTTGLDRVACAECGRSMERFVMYRCCVD